MYMILNLTSLICSFTKLFFSKFQSKYSKHQTYDLKYKHMTKNIISSFNDFQIHCNNVHRYDLALTIFLHHMYALL